MLKGLFATALAALAFAAADTGTGLPDALTRLGRDVIAPQTATFRAQAERLKSDVAALCVGYERNQPSQTFERAAKASWSDAMLTYHRLAAVPVGPLTDNGRVLTDNLYSWPRTNLCGVDLEVAALAAKGTPNTRLLFTLKGLAAIEYLLFEPTLGTQCNPKNARHRAAFEWAKKSELEKKADRCRFAAQLSEEVAANAATLETAWSPTGGDFTAKFTDGSRFPTPKKALNAVSDALFDVETTKDVRLGRPLGLSRDCLTAGGKCPELSEHLYSGLALKAVAARLDGFAGAFRGGLADYLSAVGHADVGTNLLTLADGAAAAARRADALGPFARQIEDMDVAQCRATTSQNRLVEPCALARDVRGVTVKLKSEFLTALSLEEPPTHQGDND